MFPLKIPICKRCRKKHLGSCGNDLDGRIAMAGKPKELKCPAGHTTSVRILPDEKKYFCGLCGRKWVSS